MPKSAWEQFAEATSGDAVELSGLFTAECIDGVIRCLEAGVLVSFGLSRDGGALGVTLLSDGKPVRRWFHEGGDELHGYLESAAEALARR